MPLLKFDQEIGFTHHAIDTQGPLELEQGEEVLVICVKVFQDDEVIAECDPGTHPFQASGGRWRMDAEVLPGKHPQEGAAVGAAVAVTSGPGGAMSTYTWTMPIERLVETEGGHSG